MGNAGKQIINVPVIAGNPDLGVYLGLFTLRERYGYRKDPFSSRHSLSLGLATNGPEPFVAYDGTFRHLWPGIDPADHACMRGFWRAHLWVRVAEPKATWHVIDHYPGPVTLLANEFARRTAGRPQDNPLALSGRSHPAQHVR